MMTILDEFRRIAETPYNSRLQSFKTGGGKIIGIFCSYVPEELILAAGMVPFRMRATGSTKTTMGDTWFSSFNCSYSRHLFDLALEGNFAFLDGIVFINACDHLRRMYDNWEAALETPSYIHLIAVPRKKAQGALAWYREELDIYKKSLEDHFNITITDDALRSAIRICNQVRRRLTDLYDLRRADNPPLTGAETLTVIMAGTALPRLRFLKMLDLLLKEIPNRQAFVPKSATEGASSIPRLMIQSGCLEEIDHLERIENQGCAIVDDSLCFGRRYFDTLVEETEDPMDALADRYLNHLSCPRMGDDFFNRLAYTRQAIDHYRLDGLICERLKFCDLWGGESFILKNETGAAGLPMLYLERELYAGSEGQLKTRIQAFLERIGKR